MPPIRLCISLRILPLLLLLQNRENPEPRRSWSHKNGRIEGWQLENVSSVADPVIWEKSIGPDGNMSPQRAPWSLHLPQVSKLWKDTRELGVIIRVIKRAKGANRMEASRQ